MQFIVGSREGESRPQDLKTYPRTHPLLFTIFFFYIKRYIDLYFMFYNIHKNI